jgi:iron complex transport system ATP-binding protein
LIEIRGLNQSYDRRRGYTLRDIDLTIREREVTALVGANGAGKSTLLGVMANIVRPLSGAVLLDGEDVRRIKANAAAKKLAFLKQTLRLGIRITVEELAEYGRFPHCGGRPRGEDMEKIDGALRYMKLAELRGRYLDELSGGQRQRAFIAMILAQDTPYIFLDEPLNNLDIKHSVEMMKIVKRLVAELGKTVVIVLHDVNFAAAYADRVVAMKDGRIIGEGSPEEMITKDVLDRVFDHDFNIAEHGGRRVCLYY